MILRLYQFKIGFIPVHVIEVLWKIFETSANKSFWSHHMDHLISLTSGKIISALLINIICTLPQNITYVQCPLQNLSVVREIPRSWISAKTEVFQSSKKVKIEICLGNTLEYQCICKGPFHHGLRNFQVIWTTIKHCVPILGPQQIGKIIHVVLLTSENQWIYLILSIFLCLLTCRGNTFPSCFPSIHLLQCCSREQRAIAYDSFMFLLVKPNLLLAIK